MRHSGYSASTGSHDIPDTARHYTAFIGHLCCRVRNLRAHEALDRDRRRAAAERVPHLGRFARRGFDSCMDDYDRRAQANLPAVVVPRSVTRASRANQRLTRWHFGGLPDQLRRASRHPVVVGSLTVAAELIAHAGLRWALAARGRSAGPAESAIARTPATVPDGESVVLWRRTVVVESWMVRSRRR
jgi:hypothetical protein